MDYLQFLRNAGFRAADRSGHRIIERGTCVYIFAWDISEYSLWYTALLLDCLFVKLGYFVLCEAQESAQVQALLEAQPQLAPAFASVLASFKLNKVLVYSDQSVVDTCSFRDPEDVQYADLQNLFNSKLGVQLPPPPPPPPGP